MDKGEGISILLHPSTSQLPTCPNPLGHRSSEDQARAFGLATDRFTARAVLIGAGVVALAVAYGGLVAFVGLIAPHIARWWVGPRHRALLPVSATMGIGVEKGL